MRAHERESARAGEREMTESDERCASLSVVKTRVLKAFHSPPFLFFFFSKKKGGTMKGGEGER